MMHANTAYSREAREPPIPEEATLSTALRRIPNPKGYQSIEDKQRPDPTFPDTLASYVLVFDMDEDWQKLLDE
jgi:hypothetical protein